MYARESRRPDASVVGELREVYTAGILCKLGFKSVSQTHAPRALRTVVSYEQHRTQEGACATCDPLSCDADQMGEVYRPVQVMLAQADHCAIYMQRELGFEFNDVLGYEFVRPFALWPHLEVLTVDYSPKFMVALKGSPYKKYSLADIALLEDPASASSTWRRTLAASRRATATSSRSSRPSRH